MHYRNGAENPRNIARVDDEGRETAFAVVFDPDDAVEVVGALHAVASRNVRELATWDAQDADVREVLEYVSRGRRFVDVEPYPDFQARRALGTLADRADAAEQLRKLAKDFRSRSDQAVVDALAAEQHEDECDSPAECHGAASCWTWKLAAHHVEKLADSITHPAPAAAAVQLQWGVRFGSGARTQVLKTEKDARQFLKGFEPGRAELVTRTVSEWQPAVPEALAEQTATEEL